MGQYSEGWITVPGKGKKWRTSEGKYSDLRPGFGSQTLGGVGTAISNVFRPVKQRAFPDTFREEYDKDGAYVKPDRSGGFYGPGGNPSGSGMGQAQQTPGIGPYQGHPSRSTDERTTTNANGVTQTMKAMSSTSTPIDMSRSFDDLLNGVGVKPFSGTQLPTTMGNPYTATYEQTAGFGDEVPDIGGYNGATYDSEGGRNAVSSRDLSQFENFSGNEARIAGGSERISQQATGITSGRLSDALNGVMEQEANREMTPERRRAMASMAFYNADNVMDGLKARDAVNDVVYAGGQHYGRGALTEDGKLGDKYEIDRDHARDIASGKQTASGLRDVYIDALKKSKAASTPVEKQEPATMEKPDIKQSFGRTETISAPINTDVGGSVEFNSNNDNPLPAFGAPTGYKPQSKRIDTSMPNPFSR